MYRLFLLILSLYFCSTTFAFATETKAIVNVKDHPHSQGTNATTIKTDVKDEEQDDNKKIKSIITSNEIMTRAVEMAADIANKAFPALLQRGVNREKLLNAMKHSLVTEDDQDTQQTTKQDNDDKLSFSLQSIFFYSQDLWSIWLNNNKYTNENTQDIERYLDILSITSKQVKFLLRPKNKLIREKIDEYQKAVHNDRVNPRIRNFIGVKKLDNNEIGMTFILKTNQTFELNSMKIIEGKNKDK